MKTNFMSALNEIYPLSLDEMQQINGGGGFWNSLGMPINYLTYYIYHFGKAAAEYQASLPANLKK